MTRHEATVLAGRWKALADPARLLILRALAQAPDRTMRVIDVTAAVGYLKQPTITHHLGILLAAGLVTASGQGWLRRYSLDVPELDAITVDARRLGKGR